MRRLAGAVSILTVQHDGTRAGLTATAVMSVSAEPPRLVVCVNRDVFAHDLVRIGGPLCVNVLDVESLEDARRFAGMVDGVAGDARFRDGAWREGCAGAPVLEAALAAFECRVVELIAAVSHTLVLCEVVAVHAARSGQVTGAPAMPLVYFDGRFASVGEL
ncbi:flavin reductase family protein [Pseudothauera rhizosphaerae]|nr:flavin reductase family protein [Pseudothauera rhizosphaerae]